MVKEWQESVTPNSRSRLHKNFGKYPDPYVVFFSVIYKYNYPSVRLRHRLAVKTTSTFFRESFSATQFFGQETINMFILWEEQFISTPTGPRSSQETKGTFYSFILTSTRNYLLSLPSYFVLVLITCFLNEVCTG